MTISSNTNFFNQISSNIAKTNITNTNSDSFTIYEEKEITAFTEKIEGVYSTYTTKELLDLSYDEMKENYKEIKEEIDYRLKESNNTIDNVSFTKYTKRLEDGNLDYKTHIKAKADQHRLGELTNELFSGNITQEEMNRFYESPSEAEINDYIDKYNLNSIDKEEFLDSRYGKITKSNKEHLDLLNLEDKFKIVGFFDNEELNKIIFSQYEVNVSITDKDLIWAQSRSSTASIKGYQLNTLLLNIKEHAINPTEETSPTYVGYAISDNNFLIGGLSFNLKEIDKSNENLDKIQEPKETEQTNNLENVPTDYNEYIPTQLRQISFDEVKENYEQLKTIVKDSLKSLDNLETQDTDNILAFKVQLEKIYYTEDDSLNESIYNKLQSISDPKVAIWSNSLINENINELQKGNVSSVVLNGDTLFSNNIQTNTSKEKSTSNNEQIQAKQVNIDTLINIVSNNSKEESTYNQDTINAYSKYFSQYIEIRNSLIN